MPLKSGSRSLAVETNTGALFGGLWGELTPEQYRDSINLFTRRFEANGFDLSWFTAKTCLDAGTGSGRYAAAMASHGAAKVVGVDISSAGLDVARTRNADTPSIEFREASVLNLPFDDCSFDFVCCAGVLHHTPSIQRGLDEIERVLKPGGKAFILLYGVGGLRWKLVTALRPLAMELGNSRLDEAIATIGLPANNRKHFMDDLLVPIQTFTAWADLETDLKARGFSGVERWQEGRFDHERSPLSQVQDMEKLKRIFEALSSLPNLKSDEKTLGAIGLRIAEAYISEARSIMADPNCCSETIERVVIGEGNQRALATKGS